MEKLEKVELVREKCGVSYEEARNALEACAYDVLDAIVTLEREGKAHTQTASYSTTSRAAGTLSDEMAQAQSAYEHESKGSKFGELWEAFCAQVKKFIRAGLDMSFVAERHGDRVVSIPVLFVVVGIFLWGVTLWLLLIGLFFGFRYRIEGADAITIDVNEAMDKAADVADDIRRDFTKDE